MKKKVFLAAAVLLASAILLMALKKPDNKNKTTGERRQTTVKAQPLSGSAEAKEGEKAPDFALTNLSGQTVKLSDFKGRTVILNFWASWCPPCKAEMPDMQRFYEKNPDVAVLAVNLTNTETNENAPLDFVKKNGLAFQILFDMDGSVGTLYKTVTIPTTYFIDAEGTIIRKIIGPMDEKTMAEFAQECKKGGGREARIDQGFFKKKVVQYTVVGNVKRKGADHHDVRWLWHDGRIQPNRHDCPACHLCARDFFDSGRHQKSERIPAASKGRQKPRHFAGTVCKRGNHGRRI
nr:TlpA disulfide reductase family protein [Heyndrickxia coagulans]